MDEILTELGKSIAAQGVTASILMAIIWLSARGVWVWSKDADARVAQKVQEYEALLRVAAERLDESRKDKIWWQTVATQALGIAERIESKASIASATTVKPDGPRSSGV